MLKVHLSDGRTAVFNLADPDELAVWMEHARSSVFQAQISGLTIQANGVQYSLPRPNGFARISMEAERIPAKGKMKGGEKITLQAGEIRITLFVHAGPRCGRVNVDFTGTQVFNPLTDRNKPL